MYGKLDTCTFNFTGSESSTGVWLWSKVEIIVKNCEKSSGDIHKKG